MQVAQRIKRDEPQKTSSLSVDEDGDKDENLSLSVDENGDKDENLAFPVDEDGDEDENLALSVDEDGDEDEDDEQLGLTQAGTNGTTEGWHCKRKMVNRRRRWGRMCSCRRRSGNTGLAPGLVCDTKRNRIRPQEEVQAATAKTRATVATRGGTGVSALGFSGKRGIAIENRKLTPEALKTLHDNGITWGYTWGYEVDRSSGPDLKDWESAGIYWLPMVWDGKHMERSEKYKQSGYRDGLLGFNEPNFPEQANMSPKDAALLWPRVEKLAERYKVKTLVGPAVNFAKIDPFKWFQSFLDNCKGCRVDAIAVHSYTCRGRYLKAHLDMYKKAFPGLKIWLTEFACADPAFKEYSDENAQIRFVEESVPMLEADDDVVGYAWFAYDSSWGKAALVDEKGRITKLGKVYGSLTR